MCCNKKVICAGAVGGTAVFSLIWLVCMMKKKKCKKYLIENSVHGRPCFETEKEENTCRKESDNNEEN